MNNTLLLLNYNLIELPASNGKADITYLATVLSNFTYFGFAPSVELLDKLSSLNNETLISVWNNIQPQLSKFTKADLNIEKHVVYKNFPSEVLDMSHAEYLNKQMYIYATGDYKSVSQEEKLRSSIDLSNIKLKTLHLAKDNSLQSILNSLFSSPIALNKEQIKHVQYLLKNNVKFDISNLKFKDNKAVVFKYLLENKIPFSTNSASDILSLAKELGTEVSTKKFKFKSLKRSERKYILNILNSCKYLKDDIARSKEEWKRFIHSLHPNDYKAEYPNVSEVYDLLYKNDKSLTSFNSRVEQGIKTKDIKALEALKTRPGEFARRLLHLVSIYEQDALNAFKTVSTKLTTLQLLKLRKFIEFKPEKRLVAPLGQWSKLQVLESKISNIQNESAIVDIINNTLKSRTSDTLTNLSESTKLITIPSNNSELPYGRGTVFPIPSTTTFIRSSSYWQVKNGGVRNVWYDNGWMFLSKDFSYINTICWNNTNVKGSVFSGDPTSAKTSDGKACQVIDLYLDELRKEGVKYCVWGILCYSKQSFSENTVIAGLQWGDNPLTGKIFEPARAQANFVLEGKNLSKYIAYLDIEDAENMKLVYLDANLSGSVQTLEANATKLTELFPLLLDYNKTQPSVYDVFEFTPQSDKGLPISYDDENLLIIDQDAYIFKPTNVSNNFNQIDLNKYLNQKD